MKFLALNILLFSISVPSAKGAGEEKSSTTESYVYDEVSSLNVYSTSMYSITVSWYLLQPSGNVTWMSISFANTEDDDNSNAVICYVDAFNSNSTEQYYTSSRSRNCSDLYYDSPLSNCTLYNIVVQPLDENNHRIGIADSTTSYTDGDTDDLPSSLGMTCQPGLTESMDSQITVTWNYIQRCFEKEIEYGYDYGSGYIYYTSITSRNETGVIITTDVVPFTEYQVKLNVEYEVYENCTCTTPEGAPSEPTRLKALEVSKTSATLHWEAPYHANGIIRDYSIEWLCDNMDSKKNDSLGTPGTQYTITGLVDRQRCDVEVRAVTTMYGEAASYSFTPGDNSSMIIGISIFGGIILVIIITLCYLNNCRCGKK